MAERVAFLNTAYRAYHHRERPEEDADLTHVGPGTPCGEYLRRFWQPIITSEALQDLPRRLRIMGEDLVAFRDQSGAVGLLELHCPHRGTSLEFGLVSEKGIRCCYHGWRFDVDGKILETPGATRPPSLGCVPRPVAPSTVIWTLRATPLSRCPLRFAALPWRTPASPQRRWAA